MVGSYRIERLLGQGGMGEVYEAVHPTIGQRAAVKVLLPRTLGEDSIQRFFNEARAVGGLNHPGLVKVYDIGQLENGTAFLLMELLSGMSLRARLSMLRVTAQRMAPQDALRIARHVALALGAAHAAGIVHRDIKPENLFLVPDLATEGGERAKVLDFGIAKFLKDTTDHQTVSGILLGTPRYMAPEQCEGRRDLSDRVDIYALAVVLFEMLAGRPPFDGETGMALLRQHLLKPPPALARLCPGLPRGTGQLVAEMLAKDPAQRPSAVAVVARIDDILSARNAPRAATPGRWLVVVVVALAASALAWRAPWRPARPVTTTLTTDPALPSPPEAAASAPRANAAATPAAPPPATTAPAMPAAPPADPALAGAAPLAAAAAAPSPRRRAVRTPAGPDRVLDPLAAQGQPPATTQKPADREQRIKGRLMVTGEDNAAQGVEAKRGESVRQIVEGDVVISGKGNSGQRVRSRAGGTR